MASPYERFSTGKQDSLDLNQSFNPDNQVTLYAPHEDRRVNGQDMNDKHNNEDSGVNYLYAPEHSPSLKTYRARPRAPDLQDNRQGQTSYGERDGKAEYGGTGFCRDAFGNGDNNQHGKFTGMARANINDRFSSDDKIEQLGFSKYHTSTSQPYNNHPSMNFEEDGATDDGYTDSETEDDVRFFVPENDQTQKMHHAVKVTSPRDSRLMQPNEFNVPVAATLRLPPRSARVGKRYNVNLVPPTVPTSSISDAALLKRGLKRSKNSVMSKKSHGPNDPENILIVNLRENENKTWPEICLILNERRIKEGKTPSFTPNGCHNRYNRNAPILFAAEGKEFIPVSMQRKMKKNPKGPMVWDDETDTMLIKAVKQVESRKWIEVAQLFNTTGPYQITPAEAALRTKVI